jgi:GxxExxY protein
MALIRSDLAQAVIGIAINVHKLLGPGLYEGVYESCVCEDLAEARFKFVRQHPLAVNYKRLAFPRAFRVDLIVEGELLLELKAIERIAPVHEAQVMTYLRLSGASQALLINFNVPLLKYGIKSFLKDPSWPPIPSTPSCL